VQTFGLDKVFNHHVYTRGDLARAEGVNEIPLYPFLEHRQRLIKLAIADLEDQTDVWVLGDSPNELHAAKSLGSTTVGVLTGFFTEEELAPNSTYVIKSVADIPTLL
jgi:phosphoglycolate phosphatase-like HAD superfamily hydrolase